MEAIGNTAASLALYDQVRAAVIRDLAADTVCLYLTKCYVLSSLQTT